MVRPVVAISALCAAVVIALGLAFGRQPVGSALDQSVYSMIYKQFVGERALLQAMLMPTEPVLLIIVIALVVMLAIARHRPRLAVLAIAGPLVSVGLCSAVLKPLFARTINNGSLAFPSGHTSGLVSVLTVLILAVLTNTRAGKALKSLVIVAGFVIAAVAAVALVGMKYHYITDTVGGGFLAVTTVLAVALGIDWVASKRRQVTKVATSGVAL
jgi:membrane-associated phospholipid phosphatase